MALAQRFIEKGQIDHGDLRGLDEYSSIDADPIFMQGWPHQRAIATFENFWRACRSLLLQPPRIFLTSKNIVPILRQYPMPTLPARDYNNRLIHSPEQIEELDRDHGFDYWPSIYRNSSDNAAKIRWASFERCKTDADFVWLVSSPERLKILLTSITIDQYGWNISCLAERGKLLTAPQIAMIESTIERYQSDGICIQSGNMLSVAIAERTGWWSAPIFHPHLSWARHMAYVKAWKNQLCRSVYTDTDSWLGLECWPAHFFWVNIYHDAGHVVLSDNASAPIRRVLAILAPLPLELKMLICNRIYNCPCEFISGDNLKYARECLEKLDLFFDSLRAPSSIMALTPFASSASLASHFLAHGEAAERDLRHWPGFAHSADDIFLQGWPYEQARLKALEFADFCHRHERWTFMFWGADKIIKIILQYPNLLTESPIDTRQLTNYPEAVIQLEREHNIRCWWIIYDQVRTVNILNLWHRIPISPEGFTWYISDMRRFSIALRNSTDECYSYNIHTILGYQYLLTEAHIREIEDSARGPQLYSGCSAIIAVQLVSVKFGDICGYTGTPEYNPRLPWRRYQALCPKLRGASRIDHWPAMLFWQVVLVSDGYLASCASIAANKRFARFFAIIAMLPLELQMRLCNLVYGCADQSISGAMLTATRECLEKLDLFFDSTADK